MGVNIGGRCCGRNLVMDILRASEVPPVPPVVLPLRLDFFDITALPFDYTDVGVWNAQYGWDFTVVVIVGNRANLSGGTVGGLSIFFASFQNSIDIQAINDFGGFIVSVGDNAFENSTIQTVELDYATTFGTASFASTSSLVSVSANALTTVGESCFNTSGLPTFNGPAVLVVEREGFNGCAFLDNVQLPLCTTIRDTAFSTCQALVTYSMPSVTLIEFAAFAGCDAMDVIDFQLAVTIGNDAFNAAPGTNTTLIRLSSCTSLGPTVGDDNVFFGRTGGTIDAFFPVALATADGGLPDGDIQYLEANNTASVTYV